MRPMVLALWLVLLQRAGSVDAACPLGCECTQVEGRAATRCSDAALRSVPSSIPPATMILYLDGNPLLDDLAAAHYFSRRSLANVVSVDVSRCNITRLHSDTFAGMVNMADLDLSANQLTLLPDGWLVGLPSLRVLRLGRNFIRHLSLAMLRGLASLEELDVSANRVASIDNDSFEDLPNLQKVDLSANSLVVLAPEAFMKASSLNLLNLMDNPWRCDCQLRALARWLRLNDVARRPLCVAPAKLRGKSWDQLNANEFACAPQLYRKELILRQTLPAGSSVKFFCPLHADPQPAISWKFRNDSNVVHQLHSDSSKYLLSTAQDALRRHAWIFALTIYDIGPTDVGHYECMASNSAGVSMELFALDVEQDDGGRVPSSGVREGAPHIRVQTDVAVVVLALALLLCLLTLVSFACCCIRRRRKRRYPQFAAMNGYGYQVIESGALPPKVPPPPPPPLVIAADEYGEATAARAGVDERHHLCVARDSPDDSGYLESGGSQPSPRPTTALLVLERADAERHCGVAPLAQAERDEPPLPLRETAL